MTPSEALLLPKTEAYVVIDALRATTTIAVLFHRGLKRLRVVSDVAEARRIRREGTLLLGEQGGLPPEGFDFGNSPVEAAAMTLTGREAVHVTSNGTKALCAVAGMGTTVAGSLANLSVVSNYVARFESVTLVCSGNTGAKVFALEDFAVAAAFVQRLLIEHPGAQLGDAAILASRISEPISLIAEASHAEIVRGLGLGHDIEYVARVDVAPSVPLVVACGVGWAELENVRPDDPQ